MKPAITPSKILLEGCPTLMGGSQNALTRAIGISPRSIDDIVLGRWSITSKVPLKLDKFFNRSARFWFRPKTAF